MAAGWSINSGPSTASRTGNPCEPLTRVASSGMTSSSMRKPSFGAEASWRSSASAGQSGIEEQLGRVVAGLAVDVDGAGEVGGAGVVEPVVVREPRIRLGDRDELARARVVEVISRLPSSSSTRRDAGRRFESAPTSASRDGRSRRRARPGGRRRRTPAVARRRAARGRAPRGREQASFAQHAVEVHRARDRRRCRTR